MSFICVTSGQAMTPEHNSTVIIGGGIIGLSTAYYLALSNGGSGAGITIVGRAPRAASRRFGKSKWNSRGLRLPVRDQAPWFFVMEPTP